MTPNPSFREIESLSAYLDGQLKPSEAAILESRLAANPELRAVLEGLRQARSVIRQLPQRRAPRNFTLTPKMVGMKPPLPRSYPVFRFASAVATLLLFLSFATNFMATRLPAQAPSIPYGIGGGAGGGADQESQEPALAMEAPAEPAAPAAEEPGVIEEPAAPEFAAQAAAPTSSPQPEGEAFRAQSTAMPTQALTDQAEEKAGLSNQLEEGDDTGQLLVAPPSPEPKPLPVPLVWQVGLFLLVILNSLILLLLRRNAASRWRDTK